MTAARAVPNTRPGSPHVIRHPHELPVSAEPVPHILGVAEAITPPRLLTHHAAGSDFNGRVMRTCRRGLETGDSSTGGGVAAGSSTKPTAPPIERGSRNRREDGIIFVGCTLHCSPEPVGAPTG
eukprot:GHVU01113925.1.p1 GENE.GHVU01113925.1~~GHVU01113925.1.p1  ORF type:complete len:124 (-),score=12.45 GHVU01113925.1:305-676(-)